MITRHGGRRDGAGRPPKHKEGPTDYLGASVPEKLLVRLAKYCTRHGLSRSAVVTELIRKFLKGR